ncbi:keratin, type I cytoskeletal 9-like [Cynara cardunculus var. scolymus]|uniref:keratin, type I cytoskeletal 9-like n=1 Tax=Cynara cardunculus var. scolymus TaxID=59895 RepID=UPI000D6294E5|nr:keratin, type I cytoskeletal 9-like [Cynara cardunculus var. scolymus]
MVGGCGGGGGGMIILVDGGGGNGGGGNGGGGGGVYVFDGMESDSETEVVYDSDSNEKIIEQNDWVIHSNPEFDQNAKIYALKKQISKLEVELKSENRSMEQAQNEFSIKVKELNDEISELKMRLVCKDKLHESNLQKIQDLEKDLNSSFDERTKLMSQIMKLEKVIKQPLSLDSKNSEIPFDESIFEVGESSSLNSKNDFWTSPKSEKSDKSRCSTVKSSVNSNFFFL